MKKRLFAIALLTVGVLSLNTSCSDDFVERKFYQNIEQAPLTNYQEIQAFLRGALVSMRSATYYGCDFLAYGEIRSDYMYSNKRSGYYTTVQDYSMLSSDAYARDTWNQIYTMIAKTNIVINTDVDAFSGTSNDLTNSRFVQGQAYALRALGFFDLLRLYGQKYTGGNLGVVLPLEYDPKAKMPRATITETEAQIEADFNKAIQIMTANSAGSNSNTVTGKTDVSLNAVKGLMSRFYLYKGDYAKVRQLTNEIVASNAYRVVDTPNLVNSFKFIFNASSSNSIFELAVGQVSALGTTSYSYKINPNGYSNIQMKSGLFSGLYTANDVRRGLVSTRTSSPAGQYVTGKYTEVGTGKDNIRVLRYEEILLNGAEAELNGGDATKALDYYNQVITNRGLEAATAVTLADVKLERVKEFLGEGLRQWDLLRWGDTSFKPASVSVQKLAFPIPRAETDIAGSLIQANPGYDN